METRSRQPITPAVSAVPADRANEVREEVTRSYEYLPPGQLPNVRNSPDWTARWVRYRIRNADDPKNISMQLRDGYTPVPYEHRAEVLVDPDSVSSSASGNIEIGDVVLCRRSAERSKARKQYYANKTLDAIRGAKNTAQKAVDQPRYGSISDDSETSFEARRGRMNEFGR